MSRPDFLTLQMRVRRLYSTHSFHMMDVNIPHETQVPPVDYNVVVCPGINGIHEFLRLRLLSLVSLGFHSLEQRLVEKTRLLITDVAPLRLLGAFLAVAAVDSFARTIIISVPKKRIKIMLISTSSKCLLLFMAPLSVNYIKQLRKGHPFQTKSACSDGISDHCYFFLPTNKRSVEGQRMSVKQAIWNYTRHQNIRLYK